MKQYSAMCYQVTFNFLRGLKCLLSARIRTRYLHMISPHPVKKKKKKHLNFAACFFVFAMVVCRTLLQADAFASVFSVVVEQFSVPRICCGSLLPCRQTFNLFPGFCCCNKYRYIFVSVHVYRVTICQVLKNGLSGSKGIYI